MASLSTTAWPALHDAQRSVLREILRHGSRSRAELTRRTGLSRASLSRLSRDLVDLGLVTEGETQVRPGRGRPSETFHPRADAALFAGIKLTGDTLYAAVVDLTAEVIATEEHPLPSRDVQDVVNLIDRTITHLRTAHQRIVAVGVCLAGDVVDSEEGRQITGSAFLGWDSVSLARLVNTATGLPTEVSNDVQSLTAAHHWFGEGRGTASLALIGLGIGIGAGLVIGDEPVRGSRGHPGKVGHLRVTSDGPRCDRGHVGCVSSYVTIAAIQRNAGGIAFDDVLHLAESGDIRSRQVLQDAVHALGTVIGALTSIVDVEKVIVTGEGLPIAEFDRPRLAASVDAALDPASENPNIHLHPFQFADYAWAAAVSAIRLLLTP